jgi:ankyrin repeat protein
MIAAGHVKYEPATEPLPLHVAAMNGSLEIMFWLFDSGIFKVQDTDTIGFTALHFAARYGQYLTVQFLLNSSTEVDAINKINQTALHYAAENGHDSVVRLLLDRGADRDAKEAFPSQKTALHYAAENGHDSVVRLLLYQGADRDARDGPLQKTALHYAAENEHDSVVRLLLDDGVDRNFRDGFWCIALDYAMIAWKEGIDLAWTAPPDMRQ